MVSSTSLSLRERVLTGVRGFYAQEECELTTWVVGMLVLIVLGFGKREKS